jgi:hypothetical protein
MLVHDTLPCQAIAGHVVVRFHICLVRPQRGLPLVEAAMKPRNKNRAPVRGLHSTTFQLNVSTFSPMRWGAWLLSVT